MKAFITGASSGLGREFAVLMAKRNIDVVLLARRKSRLLSLKEELEKTYGINAETVVCDLSKEEDCLKLEDKIKECDILINNAGFGKFGLFAETDLKDETELINVNVKALHILTKFFVKNRKSGYILNVASIAGFMAGPLLSSYYASKAYVLRLSQALSEEMKSTGRDICVSVLCPGPVNTEFDDVAGVKFALKNQTPSYVADYAVKKMFKKKRVIIPGLKIKLLIPALKILPERLMVKCTYKMQKKKCGR